MKCAVAVAVLTASVTACSVDGTAQPQPDLSSKAVSPTAFPYGVPTAVPPAQVPGAIADITFVPLRKKNQPEECTPAPVQADGATVQVGPGGPAGGTLTVLVARASDDFAEFVDRMRECPQMRLGGTVGTEVGTRILEVSEPRVESERTLSNSEQTYAHIYELAEQRGDVRLYVQNRRSAPDLDADERRATRTLFQEAVKQAFAG